MPFNKEHWLEELRTSGLLWPFMTNYLIFQSNHSYVHYFSHPNDLANLISAGNEKYHLNANILPMDLTMEAECFGALVQYKTNTLPNIINPVALTDVVAAGVPEVKSNRYRNYIETVARLHQSESDPTIAFVTGPFTLLSQIISHEKMKVAITDSRLLKKGLSTVTDFIIEYLRELQASGLNGFILCEPSIQFLSRHQIINYSTAFIEKIAVEFPEMIFGYHSCIDDISRLHQQIAKLNPDIVSIGRSEDLYDTFNFVLESTIVLGNIATEEVLIKDDVIAARLKMQTEQEKYRKYPNFVQGFSCDIPNKTKPENIEALVAYFHKTSTN